MSWGVSWGVLWGVLTGNAGSVCEIRVFPFFPFLLFRGNSILRHGKNGVRHMGEMGHSPNRFLFLQSVRLGDLEHLGREIHTDEWRAVGH